MYEAVTIQRHISTTQRKHPEATGELSGLLNSLAFGGKLIQREVRKAGLVDILGLTGRVNVQGEPVQKLDIYSHHLLVKVLSESGYTCVMASEEEQDVIHLPKGEKRGNYAVAFDPLDGSSNIDANISIGTIFSIFRRRTANGPGSTEDLVRPGREQVAAGYILYGSSTMMVFTTGDGVHGFTYDPSVGAFLLSHPNIKIPVKGNIYSVNEGNAAQWCTAVQEFVKHLKESDAETDRPYSLRYVGSLVADFHRTLLYGGIFMYPSDDKNKHGKLRVVYECAPLAMLAEQAGGRALCEDGEEIRDLVPKTLHDRTPLFIGSEQDVEQFAAFLRNNAAD
ncbi:MAG: class 1 fructose-bisphosphatase [Candidatus Lernaella stagnicola]|nr:class 1 fructose-bisphosphatase [Candidatus Lernaella stagnicola]